MRKWDIQDYDVIDKMIYTHPKSCHPEKKFWKSLLRSNGPYEL